MRKYKLLYVIGDSISLGYCPYLITSLEQAYGVLHAPGNSGTSTHIAENLDDWLAGYDLDLVLFNCGLHDVRCTPKLATPLDQYEANLRSIVARLGQLTSQPRLVWASTTPVINKRHKNNKAFVRYTEDVVVYNGVADTIMVKAGVESIDLHEVVMRNEPEVLISPDGVHFTAEGYSLLAQTITDYLLGSMSRT